MMSKRNITAFAIMLMGVLLLSGFAQAIEYESRTTGNFTRNDQADILNSGDSPALDVIWVKINGDIVENGDEIRLNLERDQEIKVKVQVMANQNINDLTVEAEIFGNEHGHIADVSETFNAKANTLYIKELTLELPSSMELDNYDLRVSVAGRTGAVKTYNYPLTIDTKKHSVIIKDVSFNPSNEVLAGRALLTVVRIKNTGLEEEESVKVTVSIPGLGVSATDYIDDLEPEEYANTEEMYLRMPSNAKTGDYKVNVKVLYDEGYKETDDQYTIRVVGSGDETTPTGTNGTTSIITTTPTTQITAGPQTQDAARGQGGAIYSVSVTNPSQESKSYTISVTGVESFGTLKISPSTLLVIGPGKTETFYVYVAANEDATLGTHTFGVQVKSGDQLLKEFPLNLNVIEAGVSEKEEGWDSVKKGLLVSLAILVVIVIVLGLIIVFNRMKGSEEIEEEAKSQTYY
ncbi:MAG: hypothetical protein N3D84_02815 [Candidatus Woesearchaeota archaeon]|nr:hypothetical protein [Candidatus Woesearchaeota archaeon]